MDSEFEYKKYLWSEIILWIWWSISQRFHGEFTQASEHQKSIFLQYVAEHALCHFPVLSTSRYWQKQNRKSSLISSTTFPWLCMSSLYTVCTCITKFENVHRNQECTIFMQKISKFMHINCVNISSKNHFKKPRNEEPNYHKDCHGYRIHLKVGVAEDYLPGD